MKAARERKTIVWHAQGLRSPAAWLWNWPFHRVMEQCHNWRIYKPKKRKEEVSTPKDGGPAFPVSTGHHPDTMMKDPRIGMTLRDYFAGKAMQGLLAAGTEAQFCFSGDTTLAAISYGIADAMLAERERTTRPVP
jgi:hypothetical protein